MQGAGEESFLAEESDCEHVQRGVQSTGECRGGSDKPSPGWLLKWDRSSAAPRGGSRLEPNWQKLGQRAGFTLQPPSNERPPMTHGQERNRVLASGKCLAQDPGGLVSLGCSVLLSTVPNVLSTRPSIN